jgi:hypothetical protein
MGGQPAAEGPGDPAELRQAAPGALGPDGPQQAWDAWQQSLAILDDLRHPEADEVREKLRRLGPAHQSTLAGRPAADGR